MMGEFTYEIIGDKEVLAGLTRMTAEVNPTLISELQLAAIETQDRMRGNIPNRYTGSLEASINYDIKGLEAEIGPDDSAFGGRSVGLGTEFGRLPGGRIPNWLDIQARYGVTTAHAFAIAKSIAQRGSRGLGYVSKTFLEIGELFYNRGISVAMKVASLF